MKTAVNGTDASPVKQKTYDYDKVLADALEYFEGDELAATTWVKKYALKDNEGRLLEQSPSDMHRRMAAEFARIDANAASAALSAGTNSFFTPQRAAAMAIGSAPYTGRSSPLRDSSPMNAQSSPGSSISPSAARMPMNIGRSYSVPAFFLSAGARFTVMRLTGKR